MDTQGDAFFAAFTRAADAVAAAEDGQRALEGGRVRVRMGVHTGEPLLTEEGYGGWMSIGRLVSRLLGTAGRCSCRRRRGTCLVTLRASAISESTA